MPLPLIETSDTTRQAGDVAAKILKQAQSSVRVAYRQWQRPDDSALTDDPNASEERLHDFRVELRRLRVWVHQTRTLVRTRRQARLDLRHFAQATNPARDLEVMLALLEECYTTSARETSGTTPSTLVRDVLTRLDRLTPTLNTYTMTGLAPKPRKGKHPMFGEWLSMQMGAQQQMIRYLSEQTDAELHQARIHVKYLRYLIEPLAEFPSVAALIALLKTMQTQLGTLHDLAIFRQTVPDLVHVPMSEALHQVLETSGRQSVAIKQVFATQRDEVVQVIRWQSDRYLAVMKDWLRTRDKQMQQLDSQLDQLRAQLMSSNQ